MNPFALNPIVDCLFRQTDNLRDICALRLVSRRFRDISKTPVLYDDLKSKFAENLAPAIFRRVPNDSQVLGGIPPPLSLDDKALKWETRTEAFEPDKLEKIIEMPTYHVLGGVYVSCNLDLSKIDVLLHSNGQPITQHNPNLFRDINNDETRRNIIPFITRAHGVLVQQYCYLYFIVTFDDSVPIADRWISFELAPFGNDVSLNEFTGITKFDDVRHSIGSHRCYCIPHQFIISNPTWTEIESIEYSYNTEYIFGQYRLNRNELRKYVKLDLFDRPSKIIYIIKFILPSDSRIRCDFNIKSAPDVFICSIEPNIMIYASGMCATRYST